MLHYAVRVAQEKSNRYSPCLKAVYEMTVEDMKNIIISPYHIVVKKDEIDGHELFVDGELTPFMFLTELMQEMSEKGTRVIGDE